MSNKKQPVDNRPPKEDRHLRIGDVRSDGMVFWQYAKDYRDGEAWVTPERLAVIRDQSREAKKRYKKTAAGKSSQRKYENNKRKTSVNFRIAKNLRDRLRSALVSQSANKKTKTLDLLGCDLTSLVSRFESMFTEGMSWHNYGEWHIDHIRPCSSFNLKLESEQNKCCHFSNLQPMWAEDNRRKSDKY